MHQKTVPAQFHAPPPPAPEFNQVFCPPPPYQEDLPQNHCYRAGTRIVPANKLVLQFPYSAKPTPYLDSTYENAYCHNLILPKPGECLKKSSDLETPSSEDVKVPFSDNGRRRSLWRILVRKVTKKRLSVGLKPKSKSMSSGLKPRTRAMSCDDTRHIVEMMPATFITPTVQPLVHVSPSVKPPTPPPRGIVKPPRRFKKTSPDNSTLSSVSSRKHPSSDQESFCSLKKIKKSVSFSNIATSSLLPSKGPRKRTLTNSYVCNGYIFTKL